MALIDGKHAKKLLLHVGSFKLGGSWNFPTSSRTSRNANYRGSPTAVSRHNRSDVLIHAVVIVMHAPESDYLA